MPLLCMDPIRPLPMPYPRVEILGRYWERRWAAEPQHEMPEHRRLLRIFDQWAREAELLLTKWDERWTFWTYRRHRGLDSPYRQSWRTLDAQLKDHGRAFMDFQEIFCQRLWGTPASTTLQLQVFGEEFMVYSSEIGGPKRRWMAKGWNLFKGLLTPSDKITLSAAREHVGIVLQSVLDGMREMNKGFPKKPLVPGTKTGWKFDFLAMPMDHCLSRLVGYLLNEALAKGFKVIFPRGAAGVAGARVVGQYPIVALAGGGAPWYFWQIQKEQPVTVVHLEGWGWHVVLDGIKERWCRFWLYRDGDEQFCVPASRREGWHFEVLGGWGNLNEAVESEVGEEWLRGAAERGEPAWAKRTLLEITYTGPTAVLALTKPPPKKM
ncbi:hypothetical protein Pelo_1301 [Pelomyxa schiedti]|nr:hypothetical protein Pelo_1301 [Pelomyxa schiedti]